MKVNEKVIESIIDGINNIDIPDFYIIKSSVLPLYTIDEDPDRIGIDVKIILKEKKKKKPKEEAKRASSNMFNQSQYDRVYIGGES